MSLCTELSARKLRPSLPTTPSSERQTPMDVNLVPLLPTAQILLAALVVMLLDLFFAEHEKPLLAWISIFGLALCAIDAALLWGSREGAFADTFLLDNYSLFFTQIF